jgi:hypothetical protein
MATRAESQSLRTGSEAASNDRFSCFVERAVMAPDISKVDADRRLGPGLSAWNFCDEVMRCLFSSETVSPIRRKWSSHFSFLIQTG